MLKNVSLEKLIDSVPWGEQERVRLFWVNFSEGSRDLECEKISRLDSEDLIVPVVLREPLFFSANAILADFSRLIHNNKDSFLKITNATASRLTIVILSKEDFKLPQISSPVTLPEWFPILSGRQTYLKISDLFQQAQVDLLHCEEAKVELLAEFCYNFECLLVERLDKTKLTNKAKASSLIDTIFTEQKFSLDVAISNFQRHLNSVKEPRGYRPNGRKVESLLSMLLAVVLRSSPDMLSGFAKKLAAAMGDTRETSLSPTLFAVMLRPTNKPDITTQNWHSILLAVYQAYQLMNAAAHSGEYQSYPVLLIHSNARDLARFLSDAQKFMLSL